MIVIRKESKLQSKCSYTIIQTHKEHLKLGRYLIKLSRLCEEVLECLKPFLHCYVQPNIHA